jgi:hypothetical protein
VIRKTKKKTKKKKKKEKKKKEKKKKEKRKKKKEKRKKKKEKRKKKKEKRKKKKEKNVPGARCVVEVKVGPSTQVNIRVSLPSLLSALCSLPSSLLSSQAIRVPLPALTSVIIVSSNKN